MSNANFKNSSSFAVSDSSVQALVQGLSLAPMTEVRDASEESLGNTWLVYLLVTTTWIINRMAKNASPRSDMRRTLYCAKSALLSVIVAVCKESVSVSYQEVHDDNNVLITVREPMTGKMRCFHTALHFLSASAKAVVWNLTN